MKKITLIIFLISFSCIYAQKGLSFKKSSAFVPGYILKTKDSLQITGYYSERKFLALDPVIKFPEEQKDKIDKLFRSQYAKNNNAVEKYKELKSANSKIELIKVLIEQEEEFRKLLTDEQKIYYLSYDPEKRFQTNIEFKQMFFTEAQLMEFKKQLL